MENALLNLKSEREKRNISLDKIAAETRISLRYLQSIEEGRFNDLPGGVYNRAFIKAYCESVDLDPVEVLKCYDQLQPTVLPEKRSKVIIPPSEPDSFPLPAAVVIWSLIVLAAALGVYLGRGWVSDTLSYISQEKTTPQDFSEPLENRQPAESPLAEADLQQPTAPQVRLPAESDFEPVQPPMPENTAFDLPAVETTSTSAVIPAEVETPEARMRIELKATESCWIYVIIDGAPSIEKTMMPGGTQLFFADENARIRIGNAGGVSVKINGRPTKPLGGMGEVVSMDINPLNIKQFTD